MNTLPRYISFNHDEKNKLILDLWDENQALKKRLKAFEDKLAKNSRNSHKPSSSDSFRKFKKNKSLRHSASTKRGRPTGHVGANLPLSNMPDNIRYHHPTDCEACHHSLRDIAFSGYERKQLFDIPPLRILITEHRATVKVCLHCGHENQGDFPEGLMAQTQYGVRMKSLMVYLSQYQLLPYERIQELLGDLFHHAPSEGTLVKANKNCATQLTSFDQPLQTHLLHSRYLHCDETNLRVTQKNYWCHVASTSQWTQYFIHPSRGKAAFEAMAILPRYHGAVMHDGFAAYLQYGVEHLFCNAHHLRDLTFIHEQYHQAWAKWMMDLLVAAKKQVAWHQEHHLKFPEVRKRAFRRCFDEIIQQGLWLPENLPRHKEQKGQVGLAKQHPAKNLLDRLRHHADGVLGFLNKMGLPFDNNQAERDLRMTKVKQKISGCFRSVKGALQFARIRSYLSTARKQHFPLLSAIQRAFLGQPCFA